MQVCDRGNPAEKTSFLGLTNNPYRLDGVDMRTERGRRYRDIVDALIADFGSSNAVALRNWPMKAERMQARLVAGEDVDLEGLTRPRRLRSLSVLSQLGARARARARPARRAWPNISPPTIASQLRDPEAHQRALRRRR